jgi:hypothetical protein
MEVFYFICLFQPAYISSLHLDLAQFVVDAGAVPLAVLCLQEPEVYFFAFLLPFILAYSIVSSSSSL